MNTPSELLKPYAAGSAQLQAATAGMTDAQAQARPVPGKWSTLEVVCHLADFETVYADRIKRVLAEHRPTLFSGDPDGFARALAYSHRQLNEELALIDATRRQMVRILNSLAEADWQREGIHSTDGPLSVQILLTRVTSHIPHHVAFINQKRALLLG